MRIKYTKESIQEAVSGSKTWAEVCVKLGLKPYCGSQGHLKSRARKFGVDFSHFLGYAWKRTKSVVKIPIEKYLSNEKRINSHNLRVRLVAEGFKKDECETCHITEWMGKPIAFHLDHKDSNHFNNNLSNLTILCPNCHGLKTRESRANRAK